MLAQYIYMWDFILEACKPMTDAWGQSLKPGTLRFKQVGTTSVLLAAIQRACSWYTALGSFSSYIEIIRCERVT